MDSRNGIWTFMLVGLVVAGMALAGVLFLRAELEESPPAVVQLTSDLPAVGHKTTFQLSVTEPSRGIASVAVTLDGAGLSKVSVPLNLALPAPAVAAAFILGKDAFPTLQPGTLTVRIDVQAQGSRLRTPPPVVLTRTYAVKLQPPTLSARSAFVYPTQGGAEVVVYEVGPTAARSGVQIGEWFFAGHPLPGAADPRVRFAFFAVPYDWNEVAEKDAQGRIRLVAEDDVGNRTEQQFIHRYFPRPMPKDTVNLTDAFLEKVTREVYGQTPELTAKGVLLDDFLQLNTELRKRNMQTLRDLTARSAEKFLWTSTFLPLSNAAVKGRFADRRTYVYQGAQVDTQDHLGLDLASLANAPVPAANQGVVLLAKYLGIFGNCVVVDHGFGLMSLYAHLASIDVKEGDEVTGGQKLGATGMTGLAGGDHLHFTMLLDGLPVTPIEWWDAHWIGDRLKMKLGDALPWQQSEASKQPAKAARHVRARR